MSNVLEKTDVTSALVEYRQEDGIAFLTMNDPPANTYTYEMMRQLDEAILRARMDDGVHVPVSYTHLTLPTIYSV